MGRPVVKRQSAKYVRMPGDTSPVWSGMFGGFKATGAQRRSSVASAGHAHHHHFGSRSLDRGGGGGVADRDRETLRAGLQVSKGADRAAVAGNLTALTERECLTPGCVAAWFLIRASGLCWKCEAKAEEKEQQQQRGRQMVRQAARRVELGIPHGYDSSGGGHFATAGRRSASEPRTSASHLGTSMDGGRFAFARPPRGAEDDEFASDDEAWGGTSETFDSYLAPSGRRRRQSTAAAAAAAATGDDSTDALAAAGFAPHSEVFVEFDGDWLAAVCGPASPWSASFLFPDGSTAQVPRSLVPFRVKPRADPAVIATLAADAKAQASAEAAARIRAERRAARGLGDGGVASVLTIAALGTNAASRAASAEGAGPVAPMVARRRSSLPVAIPTHLQYRKEDPAVRRAKFEYMREYNSVREQQRVAKAREAEARETLKKKKKTNPPPPPPPPPPEQQQKEGFTV